ncbi:Brix domain-containing protein [Aphelenchoides besseyi]|nr:Brix domain-containing protein [Aphelenchoides besseyi]
MAKKRKGRSAKAAKRGLLGLPKVNKRKSNKFSKRYEKRESKAQEKRDAAALRAKVAGVAEVEESKIPRSMIIHTGHIGRHVKRLERDIRQLMLPFTAKDLQVKKQNSFKDFLVHAGPLGVSHLIVFTKSDVSVNVRFIRLPQGPTIHFKVENYSVCRDVLSTIKRPVHFQALFENSPLVVLNGFNDPNRKHLLLVQTVIQNMFPSINVDTVNLQKIRRAVLVNFDAEKELIDFRHYSIKTVPSDLSKSTKKIVQSKIPDLSKYKDISEFLINPGQLSESEFEGEQVEMELPQDLKSRGCKKGTLTKLRLVEIGPRMTLKLLKIEEGIDKGEVFYHAHKTAK